MSGGLTCKCNERHEPLTVEPGANRPARLWRVTSYRCNHSHFHGGYQSSVYSGITCLRCGAIWRTKSPYADALPMYDIHTEQISAGIACHERAMEDRGRKPYRRHVDLRGFEINE